MLVCVRIVIEKVPSLMAQARQITLCMYIYIYVYDNGCGKIHIIYNSTSSISIYCRPLRASLRGISDLPEHFILKR